MMGDAVGLAGNLEGPPVRAIAEVRQRLVDMRLRVEEAQGRPVVLHNTNEEHRVDVPDGLAQVRLAPVLVRRVGHVFFANHCLRLQVVRVVAVQVVMHPASIEVLEPSGYVDQEVLVFTLHGLPARVIFALHELRVYVATRAAQQCHHLVAALHLGPGRAPADLIGEVSLALWEHHVLDVVRKADASCLRDVHVEVGPVASYPIDQPTPT
mmetsp:Transcript_91697/g.205319  ORF Transcript_91697/g.205319 Transcript_91697/m.205319 type:complete len:210 (+) Transcript_91697:210-839(+)